MKKIFLILCVFICSTLADDLFAQSKVFTVYDTIPIRSGTKKKKLYKNIDKWFETERGTKLAGANKKEYKFKGKGYFIYSNRVKIPDIFLSPHANERCKGSIIFTIDIEIQDSIIVAKFSNFVHEAVYSEYGSMTFGVLMDYEKVPPGTCMEVEEWCNAVWADMKTKSSQEVLARSARMIPNILVRRKSYKIKEEVVQAAPEEKVDPKEYLKLENYLIKEDKNDRKEEENAAVEDKKEESLDEKGEQKEVEKQDTQTPISNEDQPVKEDKKSSKKSKTVSDNESEDEPVVEEPAKEKKQKADKKSKKSEELEESEDDDYDDE